MTIYKLRADRNHYQNVYISPHEIQDKLGNPFLLSPSVTRPEQLNWSEFWQPLEIEFSDDSDKNNVTGRPDITWWHNNQLVMNNKAYQALSRPLEDFGEWLPVSFQGQGYWLFHVTKRLGIELVDLKRSQRSIDPLGLIEINQLVFIENEIQGLQLFKTEYNNYLYNIYCTHDFKTLIEEQGLKGLLFSSDMTNSPE